MGIIFVILALSYFLLVGSRETERAARCLQRDMERYARRRKTRRVHN